MTTEELPSAALYCREGNSDKEYHLKIEPKGDGFVVNYAYGRRGGTLQTGTKTTNPVPRDQAQKVYDKCVQVQLGKGYTPTGTSNVDYVSPSGQVRAEDAVALQLLEPIVEREADRYIKDDWIAQPKYDGKRILLKYTGGVVSAQNRKGLNCGFPKVFDNEVKQLAAKVKDLIIDGEAIGEQFYAFDLVRCDGQDFRTQPYKVRLAQLALLFPGLKLNAVRLADTAFSVAEKRKLYAKLKEQQAEGIVFKDVSAGYAGKRTDRQVKLKFWKSATVLVIARNDTNDILQLPGYKVPANKPDGHRSIQAALIDGNKLVFVGDVSVPVNYPMPEPGALAEVRYLYALKASNKMYQPQYEGERDDVTLEACVLSQLRYKGEEA